MLTANTSLKEIGGILAEADRVLLFPHMNPDPDAIGSCMGLALALDQQGKQVRILMDQEIPEYIEFMIRDRGDLVTTDPQAMAEPDVCMCIDCSEEKRFAKRVPAFRTGKTSLCIDHHQSEGADFDYYYIEPEAAAASQLIYALIKEMDWPLDGSIAAQLYTGIDGDTGCFMHSNTTPQIHRIAADLMEHGVDANEINVKLHQSRSLKEIRTHVRAMQTMEVFAGGKAVMAKMTKEDFRELDAGPGDAESVIDDLRSLRGSEVAAFLREDDGLIRISLRSKTQINVGHIAERLGGGGHAKASGYRSSKSMEDAYDELHAVLERALE